MNKEKLRNTVLFILFAVLCGFPLFFNLGKLATTMWDESRNGINALEMLYDHNFIVTHFDGKPDMWNTKPPFFIWMASLCMKFFGANSFSLRLPSALSAFAIVIYSFWLSKKYLKDLLPGFFSGIVLVTSVGFIDFHVARNGDFDAMLSMWIFFYCTQFFIYFETQKRKHLLLAALFLGFAILTKGIAGCMFLPGLFVFMVINKKYYSFFKKPELYIFTLCGILIGLSYYFLREIYNPGYLKAVLENEITGRYLQTNEGHRGDIWFYLRILNDFQYSYWLYWVPISVIIIFFNCEGWAKNLGLFLFIQLLFYLLILTVSQTKLKWYDAPFFAFMALIIGLAITQIYYGVKKIFISKNSWLQPLFLMLLSIGIFYKPTKAMLQTSIFYEKEANYNGLFYGDFMEDYFYLFPQRQSLKIISYGYNPHLFFYVKVYQHDGRKIDLINQATEIQKLDTIMLCDTSMWPRFNPNYVFDTLYQEGKHKFILTLADSSELSDPMKIGEKQFFRYIGSIENNPEWFASIKEKAKMEHIDIKKQMMNDAFWQLGEAKIISPEVEDFLKKKYNW